MLNERFTFCFKITIKWNLKKLHATRLNSAKYKTHVIKEQFLKWMSHNKMNLSHGLSYDETLFLSYQKVPKVKFACFYSKEVDLYWSEDSPLMYLTLKSLLLVARIENYSKSGALLQNRRCSLMTESSSPLTLFSVSAETAKCSHILTLKWRLFLP